MVDFIFTSKKQYWAAVKNLKKNLGNDTPEGKKARAAFHSLTGLKKYSEENFQKRNDKGKNYTTIEVRKDFGNIRTKQLSLLKEQWRDMKKAYPNEKISWKEFQEIHKEPDYDSIRESYNSPK